MGAHGMHRSAACPVDAEGKLKLIAAIVGPIAQPIAADHRTAHDKARSLLDLRRKRERMFGTQLFADPAWDLLLDLFANGDEGSRIQVSSACIAANVPQSTALRWIAALVESGLVVRSTDPHDRRRAFVSLSERARYSMEALLATS